jgi:NO-binding membrane sensor protein with MHYT domain
MAHQYSMTLVVISYLVAVSGSLMALIMTRDAQENPDGSGSLVSLGALCLGGVGIWSMHFIGMIAFSIPNMNIGYDFWLTTLSLFIGIGVVYIGLKFMTGDFSFAKLIPAGIFVGLGVAAMHYTGMLAIQIQADINWDWSIITISIVIAIIAALVALWLTVHVKLLWQVVLSALVMGVAVCGMHYTGMMAAHFLYNLNLPPVQPTDTTYFIIIIGGIDAIILVFAMMVAVSEKKLRSMSRF